MAEQKKTVTFIIERQDSPTSAPYTQEFEIPYRPALKVVDSLGNATAWRRFAVLA